MPVSVNRTPLVLILGPTGLAAARKFSQYPSGVEAEAGVSVVGPGVDETDVEMLNLGRLVGWETPGASAAGSR